MTLTAKLVSDVGFTPGNPDEIRHGLLGYVTLTFADLLRLDGVTLRLTEAGRHALSFPSRSDRNGNRHAYHRPVDDRSRRILEDAVFSALGITREARP